MNDELLRDAIFDFEKNFGHSEDIDAYYEVMNSEKIIVVENYSKRAFYTINVQLIKVINLRED